MSDDKEVRMVSETGAEKGSKLARFDLIPAGPLIELAEHFGRGAKKYADRNWEAGYDWSLSFAALQRHAWAFWNGEDLDPETGTKHIIAVAWHALALAQFMDQHPDFDNRVGVKVAPRKGITEPYPGDNVVHFHVANMDEAMRQAAARAADRRDLRTSTGR